MDGLTTGGGGGGLYPGGLISGIIYSFNSASKWMGLYISGGGIKTGGA